MHWISLWPSRHAAWFVVWFLHSFRDGAIGGDSDGDGGDSGE